MEQLRAHFLLDSAVPEPAFIATKRQEQQQQQKN